MDGYDPRRREIEAENPSRLLIPSAAEDQKWLTDLPPSIVGLVSSWVTEAILDNDKAMLQFAKDIQAYMTSSSGKRADQIMRTLIARTQAEHEFQDLGYTPDVGGSRKQREFEDVE